MSLWFLRAIEQSEVSANLEALGSILPSNSGLCLLIYGFGFLPVALRSAESAGDISNLSEHQGSLEF